MITLFSFELSFVSLGILCVVALLIGMSKTGVHGAGMLAVPLLANVFGGQLSSGVLLPILIIADVFGVVYYHRHTSWYHLRILFPWAAVGIVAGTFIGSYIDDGVFRGIMAIIILISVVVMIWLERGHQKDVPSYTWFSASTGVLGGFTSMVGNLAGTVMAVYFLSLRFPKNTFIGTAAWFFLVVNWFKVPFHVFVWHTITWKTCMLGLILIPFIIVGAVTGVVVVKKLSETIYRWFIIIMTLIAAVFMLL